MTEPKFRYLSDEWLSEANKAVSSLAPVEGELVVGFRVFYEASKCVEYQTRLGPEVVQIKGGLGDAEVVFSLDWDLAGGIANGRVSPQRAFLDGEITLGGDPGHLLGFQQHLAAVDDRLASLRNQTDYSRPYEADPAAGRATDQ